MAADGQDVTSAFSRNDDGSWICIDPVTIDHPKGRIQVTPGSRFLQGTIFMGMNLAAWLDQLASKAAAPPK